MIPLAIPVVGYLTVSNLGLYEIPKDIVEYLDLLFFCDVSLKINVQV